MSEKKKIEVQKFPDLNKSHQPRVKVSDESSTMRKERKDVAKSLFESVGYSEMYQ